MDPQSTVEADWRDADWRDKGLWLPDAALAPADLVGADLFAGPFTWPVMVAHHGAVTANIATMAAYCARHGVDLAPHGKTTMAPTLFRAQLDAGAWGITVATANQALAAHRFGVPRVLLANELFDPAVLRWAAQRAAAGWEFLFYVDSLDGVDVLRAALDPLPGAAAGRFGVLVEVGYPGGRTGCRTPAAAAQVAAAVAGVPGVELAGVAGYEGMLPDEAAARGFLATVADAARAVAATRPDVPTGAGGVTHPMIVSAGGSAFFDTVVEELVPPARDNGWRVLLRSGATVVHDDGAYARTTPFRRVPQDGSLTAALRVWAQVLSAPEPGLAVLGAGKRDLSFDLDLPVPLRVRGRDGTFRSLSGARIDRLNDQHAYLVGVDGDAGVRPGELVELGISHPCTAFDHWRVIPLVDSEHRVLDLLRTYF